MKPRSRTAFSPVFIKVGWSYLLRHPLQTILMILGIALGVSVVVAIDLANASASRAFDLTTDTIAGRATHQIVGAPQGVNESVYIEIRRSGIPIPMAPIVTEYVTSPELGGAPMQLLGVDPFTELPFRNYLDSGENDTPLEQLVNFFTKPGAVLIASSTADRYGVRPCSLSEGAEKNQNAPTVGSSEGNCQIQLNIAGYEKTAQVVGLLEPADSLSRRALNGVILADIATAQELTGKIGLLSHIDLIVPEANPALLDQIESFLPQGVRIQKVSARSGTVEEMTAAFRLNLTALSLLALVVGLFLIYNTMTFSVVQRRSMYGTLRCLGVTRREIFTLVVGEAFLIGLIGASLGLLLGILLGRVALNMVTQTINDLYFALTIRDVDIPSLSLIKGALLGVFATILAAAFPAWEAASVPPREALSRSGLETKARKTVELIAVVGALLIAFGGLLLWIPSDRLGVSFSGTFAVIIGFALLTPLATAVLMRGFAPVSGRIWGALGRMAPREVIGSLSRTSVAVAALMVAVSVTIGVTVMIGSFRFTVVAWLSQTLQGDVYISSPGVAGAEGINTLDPAVIPILGRQEQIERVDVLRSVQVDTPRGPVRLAATDNPSTGQERIFLASDGSPQDVWQSMQAGAVIVSEPLANRFELPRRGGSISLFTDRGMREFPIAGTYFDYASTQGTVVMSLDTYREFWDDGSISAVALRLSPDADPDRMVALLQERLAPIQQLSIQSNQGLRSDALEVFDRTFAITSALQLLATIVAFIGVLSSLLSLQLEKRRKLGILRAIGLSVRQLWGLIMIETGLMGMVAGLLAMPTGFILSLILIYIINKRAFGWTLQLQVTPEPFLTALFVAVIAALLAGLYPARKIGDLEVADAIRSE